MTRRGKLLPSGFGAPSRRSRSGRRCWLRSIAIYALHLPLLFTAGCGLYSERLATADYTIYSDADSERVEETGAFIRRAMRGYRNTFATRGEFVPPPLVILHDDEFAERRIYTNEVRQEGYYFPFLSLIHLSPQTPVTEGAPGNTVVLHELAHHFLISAFPESEYCYWLNEGLACALEVSFFDDSGEMVRPLYHLWLHQQARRALAAGGSEELRSKMSSLIGCSWFYFHQQGNKTHNYALAWTLTYYLLKQFPGTLEERLEQITSLSDAELQRHATAAVHWLEAEPQEEIAALVHEPALKEWALGEWLEAGPVDGNEFLAHLMPLMHSTGPAASRARACGLLASLLGRQVYALNAEERTLLRDLLCRHLAGGERAERIAILKNLDRYSRHPTFLPPLIALLESPDGELRIESARALARVSIKPTIASPAFWRAAPQEARAAEVREWQEWLAEFRSTASDGPQNHRR